MPLYLGADSLIRLQLARIEKCERVPLTVIGEFTETQFAEINAGRVALGLHELAQNQIVFIGRHIYESRTKDGYTIEDMVLQIASSLCAEAVADIEKFMSCTQNPNPRNDGYGNAIRDRAIFEMTSKKPRAELFSVIPKGDAIKPKQKAALADSLYVNDPG